MLSGDLSNFPIADLLVFLGHMGKDGVLTVSGADDGVNVSFASGAVVDAYSEPGDRVLLAYLGNHDGLNPTAVAGLRAAATDTGLPVRQLLDDISLANSAAAGPAIAAAIAESLFHLCQLDRGDFKFVETAVNFSTTGHRVESLVLDAMRQVDEVRDCMTHLGGSPEGLVVTAGDGPTAPAGDGVGSWLETNLTAPIVLGDLIAKSPFGSHATIKAVRVAVDRGAYTIATSAPVDSSPPPVAAQPLFAAFRRSQARSLKLPPKERMQLTLLFAREWFDCAALIGVRDGVIERCMVFDRRSNQRAQQTQPGTAVTQFPELDYVVAQQRFFHCGSGAPDFLNKDDAELPPGDGALYPLGSLGDMAFVLYARAPIAPVDAEPAPFQLLEILAWNCCPPADVDSDDTGAPTPEVPATRAPEKPLASQKALALIDELGELPAMPTTVSRVINLLSDPDANMREVTQTISRDPALTARILRVSNSVLYGGAQEVTSLDRALVRLGLRTARSIAIVTATRSLFPTGDDDMESWARRLWQHSVETGVAARRIARIAGSVDPEEAFVAGLLHDIGKVVMLIKCTDAFHRIVRAQASGADGLAAERDELGFDHALLGGALAERWGLARELVQAVHRHHWPDDADEPDTLVDIVALADHIAHVYGAEPSFAAHLTRAEAMSELAERIGLPVEELQSEWDLSDESLDSTTETRSPVAVS